MHVQPKYHESEMIKWCLVAAMAAAIALALSTALGAADRRPPALQPNLLPANIRDGIRPMTDTEATRPSEADLGADVWQVLGLQQELKFPEAIKAWQKLTLPPAGSVWKHIALGQAFLATGDLAQAEEALHWAHEARPENAVVHYFRGILCLEQAHQAREWPEGGTSRIRLASSPRNLPLKPKSIYELEAIAELETAIAQSADVWLDELLIPPQSTHTALEPTVRDLLLAVGAENFEGKACNALGALFLERGALEIAEQYMDDATNKGMVVDQGYRDLAAEYQARSQLVNALRAYWKSIAGNSDHVTAAKAYFDNFWDAVR